MKKAIFPGSFDPFTIGHYDIVIRSLSLFDEILIGVGINNEKKTMFSEEKRVNIINQAFKNEPRVKVLTYNNLTADFAIEHEAKFIIRGLRNTFDFEYEHNIAQLNKEISQIETILIYTNPNYSYISSTMLRDLIKHKKDISNLLPSGVKI